MGKATIEYPFTDICGKVNKSDSAYFSHRNGKTFIHRIKNPYKGEPTIKQEASKNKFSAATAAACEILKAGPGSDSYDLYLGQWKSNPGGYATLRGFIFAQLYEKL